MPLPDKPAGPVVDMLTRATYIRPENEPDNPDIPETSGTNGNGPMEPTISMRDYVDSRDDAVESRLSAKLDKLPSEGRMWGMVASIIGGMFVFFVAFVALLSFGGDRFEGGMSVSPIVAASQQRQDTVDTKQDAQLSLMNQKLEILIQQTAKK